jgi:hypothetical protein
MPHHSQRGKLHSGLEQLIIRLSLDASYLDFSASPRPRARIFRDVSGKLGIGP